jgi:hypothetical protein
MHTWQSRPVVRTAIAHLALTGLLALAGCALPQGELLVTASPTLSPAGGTFTSAQTVTLADTTPSATIYYTTDGTTPTTASPIYTAPIVIGQTELLSVIAQAPHHEASSVVAATFTIHLTSPVTPQAATPLLSPASGTFTAAQTITLTDATPSASIFYTLDGSTPTTTSNLYTAPLSLTASATVNAVAIAPGYAASPIGTATYTINLPLPVAAAPVISPASGTFTTAQTIALTDATPSASIFYTLDGTAPTTASTPYTAPFTLTASATVKAIAMAPGYTASPIGAATYTINLALPVTATPTISPASGTFTTAQTVTLTDATPSASIFYTLDGTTPTAASTPYTAPFTLTTSATVRAVAIAAGYAISPVAAAMYTIDIPLPVAATPTISPASGTFTVAQTITLSDATPSASIYYTLDGSTPTVSSAVYTNPIRVTRTTTIQARALASGYTLSPTASATFTLTGITPVPTISPASGTFTSSVSVTLSDAASGATIYYTLDGTAPTASSPVYTAPLTIKATTTVRAAAQLPSFTLSPLASSTFTLIPSGSGIGGTVAFTKRAVEGASVSLYVAGQTGYGSSATPITTSSALTDSIGAFTLPYVCSTPSALAYLVATRGQIASIQAGDGLILITLLGPCGSISPGTPIVVNELTTVAAAWSLAPFAMLQSGSAALQIGTTATNTMGLANAFLTAQNLVDTSHGTLRGPSLPSTAALPTAELNTLADILSAYLTTPTALFQSTSPATDTFSAAVAIAQNPSTNVAALYALAKSTSPFQPALASAPNDFTLAVRFTGGGLDAPTSVAVDAAGSIWVANYVDSVSKFTPQGSPLSPSSGFTGGGLKESFGLAIDPTGNVWVTNQQSSVNSGNGTVTKLSSTGTILSGTNGYSSGGLNFPEAVAIDSTGNVWIANYGNSTATLLASTGTALSTSTGYGSGHLVFPVAVAIDAQNNAWFGNQGSSTITSIPTTGIPVTQVACCQGASGIALDQQGNLWTANYYGDSVSQIASTGHVVSSGYTGGGLSGPRGIAVDGAQTVWVSNYQGGSVTRLEGANSSTPGKTTALGIAAGLSLPYALAVDSTGSLWVTSSGNNSLVEFVGAATPVKTPLLGLPQTP